MHPIAFAVAAGFLCLLGWRGLEVLFIAAFIGIILVAVGGVALFCYGVYLLFVGSADAAGGALLFGALMIGAAISTLSDFDDD